MNTFLSQASISQANIWLTRPLSYDSKTSPLEQKLTLLGANVLHLPMLEIRSLMGTSVPNQWPDAVKSRILDLDHYNLVFFISTNAAQLGLSCIDHYWPQYPEQILNFSVGPSTAAILENYGLQVHYPNPTMTSEALLKLPQLAAIDGQKVLIFRGVGGRETLAQGLLNKGASVDYVELYQRSRPDYDKRVLSQHIAQSPPDGIVITSAEALENFTHLFKELVFKGPLLKEKWLDIMQTPLFVSSPRINKIAEKHGFKQIFTMPGADDGAIINSLKNFEY